MLDLSTSQGICTIKKPNLSGRSMGVWCWPIVFCHVLAKGLYVQNNSWTYEIKQSLSMEGRLKSWKKRSQGNCDLSSAISMQIWLEKDYYNNLTPAVCIMETSSKGSLKHLTMYMVKSKRGTTQYICYCQSSSCSFDMDPLEHYSKLKFRLGGLTNQVFRKLNWVTKFKLKCQL